MGQGGNVVRRGVENEAPACEFTPKRSKIAERWLRTVDCEMKSSDAISRLVLGFFALE